MAYFCNDCGYRSGFNAVKLRKICGLEKEEVTGGREKFHTEELQNL
jgi:hypothetical protein